MRNNMNKLILLLILVNILSSCKKENNTEIDILMAKLRNNHKSIVIKKENYLEKIAANWAESQMEKLKPNLIYKKFPSEVDKTIFITNQRNKFKKIFLNKINENFSNVNPKYKLSDYTIYHLEDNKLNIKHTFLNKFKKNEKECLYEYVKNNKLFSKKVSKRYCNLIKKYFGDLK